MKHFPSRLWWPALSLSLAFTAPARAQQTTVPPVQTPAVVRVDPVQALQDSVRKGDLAAVKAAIEADPKLLSNGSRGYSPLYTAIQAGKLEIVTYLLEKGADPNAGDYSNSPLLTALRGYSETATTWKPIAEALLAKGAKINGPDSEGSTPLMGMLNNGGGNSQKEKIAYLLSKGADLNARNRSGRNALETALSNSSSEILTLILEKADIKAVDDNGATPLFAAVTRGNAEYVRLMLDKGADINAQNALGDTVLHLAAQNPGAMLKILLDAGAKTNLKNQRGDLPIHIALRRRDEYSAPNRGVYNEYSGSPSDENATPRGAIIAPLTDKSDVNARDQLGLSPLLLAILARDQESRDLIMEAKPKMDSTTQLFDAVAQGNLAALQILLTQKPYLVYFRLPDGTTPLHVSALWGTLGAAQLLAKKGGDIGARDSRGETPLHKALTRPTGLFARRAKNMTAFLLEKGVNFNALDGNDSSPLHRAVKSGDAELIGALLAKEVNVNARDKAGQTPIFALMTKTSDLKIVRALVDKGANVNARVPGSTALLGRAAQTRRKELVQLLLAAGADVTAKDSEGRSALGSLLYSGSGEDSSAIVELLLAKGADPNEKIYSETLLGRAIPSGSTETVRLLLATKKVDLKAAGEGRQSPLYQAVNNGRVEIVQMLLAAGADATETVQGKSIAEYAAARSAEMGELFKPKAAPAG